MFSCACSVSCCLSFGGTSSFPVWPPPPSLPERRRDGDRRTPAAIDMPASDTIYKYGSLGLLVIRGVVSVMFTRVAVSPSHPKFLKTITVLSCELLKLFTCLLWILTVEEGPVKGAKKVWGEFASHKVDLLKMSVPALLYTAQNILFYVAIENLTASVYMITSQFKLLTTAAFSIWLLSKRFSKVQWASLIVLLVGMYLTETQKHPSKHFDLTNSTTESTILSNASNLNLTVTAVPTPTERHEMNPLIGLSAVFFLCVFTGFAGVYTEMMFKNKKRVVSLAVRNVQLCVPGVMLSLIYALVLDNEKLFRDGLHPLDVVSNAYRNFDWAVWVSVCIMAFGGLVVAVVIKFAGNILKCFVASLSITIVCFLDWLLFGEQPTALFILGATLAVVSLAIYSLFPYRAPPKVADNEPTKTVTRF